MTRAPGGRPAVVHAVGQRVYVSCPNGGGAAAALTDGTGATLATLADGTEVDIVAWRPRGAEGTLYRVRCAGDGAEGWLASRHLRGTRLYVPPAVPTAPEARRPPAGNGRDPKRRFGA